MPDTPSKTRPARKGHGTRPQHTRADLSDADLTGAKMSGTILEGARGAPPGSRDGSP
ncbi:pentapeptide repeat-containing protein [Streptomyces phaeofaciens]|uniref:pentapeptide repeat-containing protein n=1 Tax=Streptomyces phaeofaciens TaxID=68254 RepID=UPI0036A4BC88